MPSLFSLTAPLALLLAPGAAQDDAGAKGSCEAPTWQQARDGNGRASPLPLSARTDAWNSIFDAPKPAQANQVRIEGRVILRISPARGPARQSLMAENVEPQRRQLVERPFGKCIDAKRIGGVADQGSRLLLFLRDRRTLSAQLEKGCSPREFYQGFYMEPSDDGQLCVNRDRLMSRSGAKCKVASLHQMVLETVE